MPQQHANVSQGSGCSETGMVYDDDDGGCGGGGRGGAKKKKESYDYKRNSSINRNNKQEDQMLKRPIFTTLTGLLQSALVHDQPPRTLELLHSTVQQNESTSFSFPVPM